MRRVIFHIILFLLISILFFICSFTVNYNLSSYFLRIVFDIHGYQTGENYDELIKKVTIMRNNEYESEYYNNYFDIIEPNNATGEEPVIIWMHGGAYVGRGRKAVESYAVRLANEGYKVVNMEYALAPEAKYPAQLTQIGELYHYLIQNQEQLNLNMSKVYFAGDSAGAQMIAQYMTNETNNQYQRDSELPKTINMDNVLGVLLFCGPYSIEDLLTANNFVVNFFYKRAVHAYFGKEIWENEEEMDKLNVIDKVTSNFPSTFLTDGTRNSFFDSMLDLERNLIYQGVYVESVYYPDAGLIHEYQFYMNTSYARETFESLIQFLKTTEQNAE